MRLPLIKKIGEFIEFKNGLNKEKKFFGYGTPIINYMDVFNSRGINPRDIYGKVFLNKSEIGTYNAKKGDVFFTRTSETVDEIGITSVLLEDFNDTVFSGFILRGRE
jgi:type I restriction enzyme S subunit